MATTQLEINSVQELEEIALQKISAEPRDLWYVMTCGEPSECRNSFEELVAQAPEAVLAKLISPNIYEDDGERIAEAALRLAGRLFSNAIGHQPHHRVRKYLSCAIPLSA